MATNYPAGLDTTADLPASGGVGANLSTFPHSTLHGNANDAIIAIETELGVAPSGSETTVKARLDRITPTLGGLTAWTTITITQLGSVPGTINSSGTRYQRIGRTVNCWFYVTAAGSGTASNVIVIGGLPFAPAVSAYNIVGVGHINDASTGNLIHPAHLVIPTGTSTLHMWSSSIAGVAAPALGTTAGGYSAALASGDVITGQFTYEANAD